MAMLLIWSFSKKTSELTISLEHNTDNKPLKKKERSRMNKGFLQNIYIRLVINAPKTRNNTGTYKPINLNSVPLPLTRKKTNR